MTRSRDEAEHEHDAAGQMRWTVGADGLEMRPWSGESVQMPTGRLHAVEPEGLFTGRAVCVAPIVLLDPVDWRWPEDVGEEWPLCWICLALTR
ncbi:MAG TPA: hypothetical protein VGN28_13395 [Blastococcus sp.]|jgi:hypothetical protein|nr:hypothetical protein [Blastococcus sp.]